MEIDRLVVLLPIQMKMDFQVIAARKGKKMGPEVKDWIKSYINENKKFLKAKKEN